MVHAFTYLGCHFLVYKYSFSEGLDDLVGRNENVVYMTVQLEILTWLFPTKHEAKVKHCQDIARTLKEQSPRLDSSNTTCLKSPTLLTKFCRNS